LFMRPFRREALFMMLALMLSALFLSFSRGALIGLVLGIITLLCIATGKRAWAWVKKYWYLVLILVSIFVVSIVSLRNTEIVQDYVFHAAVSTDQQDPNEKRVTLVQGAIDDIVATPQGSGPGSAGLVAINNPQGGVLTENYYLQVAYEVGWLGAALFALILLTIGRLLQKICNKDMNGQKYVAAVLLASMSAYLFYSLLIHLWSNEAIALQWWLLMGVALGASLNKSQQTAANND
jgi:O-antigen ligase